MSKRPAYPRINCIVPDCRRGTTRYEPNDDGSSPQIICGPHWRTVPKNQRTAITFVRRKFFAAERKGDELGMARSARIYWRLWDRIVAMLCAPETVMDGVLPATLAEDLRRKGLL